MPRVHKPRVPREQTVVVRAAAPSLHVRAARHSWVAVEADDGAVSVREETGARDTVFTMPPGRYTVSTDGRLEAVDAQAPPDAAVPSDEAGAGLRLSSDAPDDAPDGIGELAADGKSACTITVEKLGVDGEAMRGRAHDDEVFLRTTGGSLVDAGGERVRSVKLKSGRASVRLVSEASPRVVTVEALGPPPLGRAELRIEFV